MNIVINLKASWVFAGDGTNSFYLNRFVTRCKEKFGDIQVVDKDLCSCTLQFASADAETRAAVEALLRAGFSDPAVYDEVCTLTIDGAEVHSAKDDGTTEPKPEATVSKKRVMDASEDEEETTTEREEARPAGDQIDATPVLGKINALVGCEDFKSFCEEVHARAERMRRHNTQDVFFGTAHVFYINEGYDLDAILNLLKELLAVERIFTGHEVNLMHATLPAFGKTDADNEKMERFVDNLTISRGQRTICIFDIEAWVGHTESTLFKKFLKKLVQLRGKQSLLVFRCHHQPEQLAQRIAQDVTDIMLYRPITIREYTNEELLGFAEQKLSRYGYDLSTEAKALFDQKLKQERMDGYFYGLDTVYKIVDEMIVAHEIYDTLGSDSISEAEMTRLIARKDDPFSAKALLAAVYGMDAVRRQIYGICNQILFARKNGIKLPSLHMKFVGNPGTGKTTMARIVGKILSEAGALRIGNLYEHKGRDLCGEYIGQTAKITSHICEEAYGSVLFIDEAYSLYQGGEKDYGKEAIETLITEMENHADDLLIIFAGYTDEMETFEKSNPGLKSRIPFTITFPNYTVDELYHIFELMVTKEFECSRELLDAAKNYFYSLPDSVRNDRQFGNARFVRNLYERTWGAAVNRTQDTGERTTLQLVDLNEAIASIEKEKPTAPTRNKIGFN